MVLVQHGLKRKTEYQCVKAHSAFGAANEMVCCLRRMIDCDEMQDRNRHSWG